MRSQPVLLQIQIIDHLDHDTHQSYETSALYDDQTRSLRYIENDGITQVDLRIGEHELSLKRHAQWQTHLIFKPHDLGSFTMISDQGEMHGLVKTFNYSIEVDKIVVNYQLIMDDSVITHQTLTYTIRGAQT